MNEMDETDFQIAVKKWKTYTPLCLRKFLFAPTNKDYQILLSIREHVRQNGLEDEFGKLLAQYSVIEVSKGMTAKLSLESFSGGNPIIQVKLFYSLMSTTSDKSEEFCRNLAAKKIHKEIIAKLQSVNSGVKGFNRGNPSCQNVIDFIDSSFIILFNMVKNFPDCKKDFRDDGCIDLALKFLEAHDELMKANALMLLSYVADISSNTEVIKATSSNMKFIVNALLGPALNSPNHDSHGRDDNEAGMACNVEEILETLSILSKNSGNAKELARLGMLDICEKVLIKKFSEKEVMLCLKILWSLTFEEEVKKQLHDRKSLMTIVQTCYRQESGEIARSAAGILFNIEKSKLNQPGSVNQTIDGHVMISYCHKQRALAWQVWNKLKESEMNVWIDATNLEGDTLDGMAKAVQDASHVVCCISEDYSNSDACRSEAVYAKQLKKKMVFVKLEADYHPKDWLGLILGDKLYYTMHDEEEIEKNFAKLLVHIQGKMPVAGKEIEAKITNSTNAKCDGVHSEQGVLKSKISWPREEIESWFKSIGCSPNEKSTSFLGQLDGELLSELCCWKRRVPDFFLKFVQDEFGFNSIDLVKFSKAVDKLSESLQLSD